MAQNYYCGGSGRGVNAWPGDQDVCPICQKWVRVRQDSTFGKHRAVANPRTERPGDFQ